MFFEKPNPSTSVNSVLLSLQSFFHGKQEIIGGAAKSISAQSGLFYYGSSISSAYQLLQLFSITNGANAPGVIKIYKNILCLIG